MALRVALLSLLLVGSALAAAVPKKSREVHPDENLTTPELIVKYGYPVEVHTVTTSDGYVLTLHRIPHNKASTTVGAPILLQHGLLCSSADWVVMGPEKGLAYILSDAGYDVWMGNSRGNVYSRKHISLDPDNDGDFWDFSWHEMGVYDLPAVLDFITAQTAQEKVFYAGHSMGTTMFFVMGAERPEYNSKIRAMFALAPIAFMDNMKSTLFQLLSGAGDGLGFLLDLMGIHEFLPHSDLMTMLGDTLCQDTSIFQSVCSNVLFLVAGYDSKNLNETMLPVILAHTPAGAATKQFLHYAQEIQSGNFRQYDYGLIENLIKYGSTSPPDYDIDKITAPIALLYGMNDLLAEPVDVLRFYQKLPNAFASHPVADIEFNHLDFLWAIHAPEAVYAHMMELMLEH